MDTERRTTGIEAVIKALDRIVGTTQAGTDPFMATASRWMLAASEWDDSPDVTFQAEPARRFGGADP